MKRIMKDGMMAKKRILNDEYELYEGRHEAIITEEQWNRAKAAQVQRNHRPVNASRQLQNPFAGILFCDKCGGTIKRNIPNKRQHPTPWYRCMTRGCDCRIIKCETVENAILDAMQQWLEEYVVQIEDNQSPSINPIDTALETVRGQIAQLQTQQESICEYLEKGIYSVEMFTKRNSALVKEIKQLQSSEEDLLRQQSEGTQKKQAATEIIPTTRHILENYSSLSPIEKNLLWKLVMKKVTVYRSPDDEVTLHVYPNLPK